MNLKCLVEFHTRGGDQMLLASDVYFPKEETEQMKAM